MGYLARHLPTLFPDGLQHASKNSARVEGALQAFLTRNFVLLEQHLDASTTQQSGFASRGQAGSHGHTWLQWVTRGGAVSPALLGEFTSALYGMLLCVAHPTAEMMQIVLCY